MSDIAFHGRMDEATYASAVGRAAPNRRAALWVISVAVVLIAYGVGAPLLGRSSWSATAPILFFAVLWVALLLRQMRVRPRSELAGNKALSGPIRGVAREDGIEVVTDYTTGNYPWSALHHYQLAGEAMLLYISPSAAHILPRSFFGSQTDWDAFVARVQANVPPTKRGSGVARVILLWILIIVGVFLYRVIFHR